MRCETIRGENEQLRKFQPSSSDSFVSKSTLPQLLVEGDSKPKNEIKVLGPFFLSPGILFGFILMGATVGK